MAEAPLDRALLADVFSRSEQRAFSGNVFQFTRDGIWLPAPLEVIASALDALATQGFLERPAAGDRMRLLDAGMGDGRFVASLCGLGSHIHAVGIESHPSLYQLALENLRSLPIANWSVCRGSYLDPAAYETLGVPVSTIDAIFNYPDGNEDALVRFWREHGRKGARLLFLTPDQSLSFDGVALEKHLTVARAFRVYVFRV